MSNATEHWETAATARRNVRQSDEGVNYLRSVHSSLSTLHDSLVRNKPDEFAVREALSAVERLGTADQDALRGLTEPVFAEDRTLVGAFRHGRGVSGEADSVAVALAEYGDGGEWSAVESAMTDVLSTQQGPMAIDTIVLSELVVVFELAVEAAIRYREHQEETLQTALNEACNALDEPLPELDEQPVALLPVRLETRFVDSNGQTDGDPAELLVRVYPDQIHTDSHEEELTDKEVRWGKSFWATLWYARHPDPEIIGDDPTARYLTERLPSVRLRERVASIDHERFSPEHHRRYAELKERAWQQLLDRFGRERAGYVVHALEPTDQELAETLLTEPPEPPSWMRSDTEGEANGDETTDANSDRSSEAGGDVGFGTDANVDIPSGSQDIDVIDEQIPDLEGLQQPTLPEKLPELAFPDVPRRSNSWTKQARARLLPDRWLAVAEWDDHTGERHRTAIAGDAVRDSLPVGPSAESVAGDDQDEETAGLAPDGAEWMVDFQEAVDVGMGLRLPLSGLAGFDPERGFTRVSVVGVKGSMDASETPAELADLLDAHHYTDGLAFLPQGTPTNNHDRSAGDDEEFTPGLSVECTPPLVENGDRSDGDLLARALSIGPDDDERHVFASVDNADGTEQRDARHMNSALWPATLGYTLEHLFADNGIAGNPSLWNPTAAAGSGTTSAAGTQPERGDLEESMLWLDAYRRHFIRYVRARGPFPTLRVGNQPYGVLPAMATETERDLSLVDPELIADLGAGELDVATLEQYDTTVQELATSGAEPTKLLEAGAQPDQLIAAGTDPKRLVAGGVEPEKTLDATGLVPDNLLQDATGVRASSRLTEGRMRDVGLPVEELEQHGVTARALARGEVTDEQLESAGVTTSQIADAILPDEARALGLTPQALERAGITPATVLNGEFSPEQVAQLNLSTRAVADAVLPPELRERGITPKAIEDAGITPQALLNNDVSGKQLQQAGITTETIAEALLPAEAQEFGITPESIGATDITVADLFNGDLTIEQLAGVGFDTQTLMDAMIPDTFQQAGITPDALENAGITPDAVLNGQVTPEDVVEAGLTPSTLADAGVLPDALAEVGETIGDLLAAGLDPATLVERGLTPDALVDAGVEPGLLVGAGLAPKRLVDAGVDAVKLATSDAAPVDELLDAGASPAKLARAGATVADLAGGDVPAKELVKTGVTAVEMLSQGVDALDVAESGARPSALRDANVDAGTLRDTGKAAGSLRVAGYTAEELLDADYSAEELLNGGFSRQELTAAGVDPERVRGDGRDVATVLAAGHPPANLREAGYAADQLLEGGLDEGELVDAGYTAGELVDAGLTTEQLVAAGIAVEELRAADVDVDSLLGAGVDIEELRERGATAEELLEAGREPADLLEAGFEQVELEAAGIDVDSLLSDVAAGETDTGDAADVAIEGMQYAATVLEEPEQAERDAYRFSFDPAVPRTSRKQTGASRSAGTDDSGNGDRRADDEQPDGGRRGDDRQADGGVVPGSVPVARPLSIDDKLDARLRRRLRGFGGLWSEAATDLPFADGLDEDGLLNALEREGVTSELRHKTMLYSGERVPGARHALDITVNNFFLPDHQAGLREVLEAADLTDIDPRIGHFYPTDVSDEQARHHVRNSPGHLSYFYRQHLYHTRKGTITPYDMVDGDVAQFVDLLLGSTIRDVHTLGDVIQPTQLSLERDTLDLEDIEWEDLDPGAKRGYIVRGIEDADDPVQFTRDLASGQDEKIQQLGKNQRDYGDSGALRSLLRILLQHGYLHAFLAARRRLGLAYDDIPSPWLDPAYSKEDDKTPLDTLWDPVPEPLYGHPDVGADEFSTNVGTDELPVNVGSDIDVAPGVTYREALTSAAQNYSSTTSIDTRLSEFTDSLQYLGGVEPSELGTLVRETLDLSSHRLDAWWTSLATKRLLELREAQGTVDPDGEVEHESWDGASSNVPRATVDPALVGNLSSGQTQTGGESVDSMVGPQRQFDPAMFSGSDETETGDEGVSSGPISDDPLGDGGVDTGQFDEEILEQMSQGTVAERVGTTEKGALHDRTQTDPGLYVGGYGFVENLSADPVTESPEYVHAPSEQQATTAALLKSGADAHEDDEGENLLQVDLSADRVRDGLWLLRGVRRGQSLGELLGYRFERRIHEATVDVDEPDLMQYLDSLRAAFPLRVDNIERPDEDEEKDDRRDELAAQDAVDGLALYRNWENYPFGYGDELPATTPPDANVEEDDAEAYAFMDRIITDLGSKLDAVNDLLVAESVHQVGQANFDRAGGSLGALTKGEQFPDPDVIRTPRGETGLTHRQCLLFGDTSSPVETPRANAAPSLASWAETMLPDRSKVECRGTYRWTSGESAETEHTESRTITLDTLDLGPLDVLLLFGADREETRSELEQRLVYHLIRNRPATVPADAQVELTLTETEGDISVAELLELARSVRELVQSARPMTAADLSHPGDFEGEGYDQQTIQALTDRANDAQDALYGVADAIDDRLAVLDPAHQTGDGTDGLPTPGGSVTAGDGGTPADTSWQQVSGSKQLPSIQPDNLAGIESLIQPPTLTEQVETLGGAIRGIHDNVPLETVESVANGLDSKRLRNELESLLADLPAGSASKKASNTDLTVEADSDQRIQGMVGEPIDVPDVEETVGESDAETWEVVEEPILDGTQQEFDAGIMGSATSETETTQMDDLAELDTTDQQHFEEQLDSITIRYDELGQPIVEPADSPEDDREDDREREDESHDGKDWSTVTATVTAWGTDGLSWFEREATTTPDRDGVFSVSLDFSTVEPGTAFQVVATVDRTVVYSATGRVVAEKTPTDDAQSTLRSDCPALQRLLWLQDREPLLSLSEGPSAEFEKAHDGIRDWEAISDERDAVDPATSSVTETEMAVVDNLVALESLDPKAVPERASETAAPIRRLGLEHIADVTGGEGGPDEVKYWLGATKNIDSVRARIDRTLANPGLYNAGAPPLLLKYDHEAGQLLHDIEEGAVIAAYLDAFLAQQSWTIRYLDRELAEPATLVRDLTAWLYNPAELSDVSDLATDLQELARAVSDLPALSALFEGLPRGDADTRREVFRTHLQSLASALGRSVSVPDANTVRSAFDTGIDTAARDLARTAASERSHLAGFESGPPVEQAFRNVVLEQLRESMTVAASYGVFGGTPRSPDGGQRDDEQALREQAEALLDRLRTRVKDAATLDPRIESEIATQPVPQRVESQTDRLERLFGDGFTVLPPFTATNPVELTATFTDDGLVPDRTAPETWLQRSAAHRDRVATFREARSYAEALGDEFTPPLRIGQVPFEEGDTWVGVDGVEPPPGRISLVAQFGPGVTPGTADGRLAGLYVDEWNEAVPDATETTGLALNYDDPGNRPPQSILLVPPPEGEELSLDHLAATVAETTEYMRRRAVDLGDLESGLSALFPALNFAQGDNRGTPTVELGMLDWYDRELVTSLVPSSMYLTLGNSLGDSE